MSFCGLTKGISPQICILCVRVILNLFCPGYLAKLNHTDAAAMRFFSHDCFFPFSHDCSVSSFQSPSFCFFASVTTVPFLPFSHDCSVSSLQSRLFSHHRSVSSLQSRLFRFFPSVTTVPFLRFSHDCSVSSLQSRLFRFLITLPSRSCFSPLVTTV